MFDLNQLLEEILLEKEKEYAVFGDSRIEESLLSKVISSPSQLKISRALITAKTFSHGLYQEIFSAACSLADDNLAIDPATLLVRLKVSPRVTVDETAQKTVAKLWNIDADGIDLESYCSLMSEAEKKRRCAALGESLTRLAKSRKRSDAIAQAITKDLATILVSTGARQDLTIRQTINANDAGLIGVMVPFFNQTRIQTPLNAPNELLDGIFPRRLYYLAARSSQGKTAWAVQWANYAARLGVRTTYCSREMSREAIFRRAILQRMTTIDRYTLRSAYDGGLPPDVLEEAKEVVAEIEAYPITVNDIGGKTVEAFRQDMERLVGEYGVKLAFFDHMQHASTVKQFKDERSKTAYISNYFRETADELGLILVVLSQLPKDVAKRADKRPQMADLPESTMLEADAEAIIMLHRPGMYDEKINKNLTEWLLPKQREGDTGRVDIEFDPRTISFRDRDVKIPFAFNRDGSLANDPTDDN